MALGTGTLLPHGNTPAIVTSRGASAGATPQDSLNRLLQTGASKAEGGIGAAQSGVGAAQSGLATAQELGATIKGHLGKATGLASSAAQVVNGASRDIDAIRDLAPQITNQTTGMSDSADVLSGLANLIRGKAGDVSAYAPAVAGLGNDLLGRIGLTDALAGQTVGAAYALQPHADALADLSEHLFGHGHEQIGRANAEMDVAAGLRNLDPASSAQAAYWRKIFDAVNPDVMAAMARADVQSQGDSAYQQQMRDLARRGVSVSSGATAVLQRQLKTALAAAAAGAMNRGRLAGYDKQAGILKETGELANAQMNTGNNMFKAGTDAEAQAAAVRKSAADVQKAMGDLFATGAEMFGIGNAAIKGAGDLYASAGGLEKASADVLSEAARAETESADARAKAIAGIATQGDMYKDAAGLQISQANALNDTARVHQGNAQVTNQYLSNMNDATRTVVSSYGQLATAMDAASRYYLGAANAEISAYGRGGGGGGGGGVRVSSASEQPDYWESTGHSSTWWKNNLSLDEYADMAREAARFEVAAGSAKK